MLRRNGTGRRESLPGPVRQTNLAGEIGFRPGPEGATAPETLRAKDRERMKTLESAYFRTPPTE